MVRVWAQMERKLGFEVKLDPDYPEQDHQSNNSNWYKKK